MKGLLLLIVPEPSKISTNGKSFPDKEDLKSLNAVYPTCNLLLMLLENLVFNSAIKILALLLIT